MGLMSFSFSTFYLYLCVLFPIFPAASDEDATTIMIVNRRKCLYSQIPSRKSERSRIHMELQEKKKKHSFVISIGIHLRLRTCTSAAVASNAPNGGQ